MTPRERQLSVISRENPDIISVDAISVENQVQVAEFLEIETSDVLDRLGIDGRILSARYLGKVPEPVNGIAFTSWGTPNTGDYGMSRLNPLADAESISEIERYKWPDAKDHDFAGAGEVARSLEKYAVRGPYWQPLFCRVCDLFGMEEAMVKMFSQPLIFEAVLDKVFDHVFEFCELLLLACGDAMPIFCLGDDFATQRGIMFPPEQWRKFLKGKYARLFEIGKKAGKFVWFHSCGNITDALPDLIDIGMDVWETVQLHTLPMSPEQLKREYGKHITFFGGVNTQRLPFATPEEVRSEVLECIRILGKGGGYICGPDHHIKPDVSPENTVALFDTAAGYNRIV